MRSVAPAPVLLITLLAPVLGGCARPESSARPWVPAPAPDLGAVVARVGEVPIHAAEVTGQAARTGKPPREALNDLIELHLLAESLRPHWPPGDPGAHQAEREMVVQRLLEREFEPKNRPEDMPDSVVKTLYDAARKKFVHPKLVEVAVLTVTVGKKATPEARAEAKKTIQELKAVVDARPLRTAEDMQQIIADGSWYSRRVQFFRFIQSGDEPYSAKFGEEARRLQPGDTKIIEDDYGFYITRYVSERPPQNQTFEMVKQELREGYYPRWRQQRFLEFVQEARSRHQVQIHTAAVAGQPGA